MLNKRKGFTLIELLVVMFIISVLVFLGAPKFKSYTEDARITRLTVEAKELEKASQQYYIRNNAWPRLSDEAYSSEDINSFSSKIYASTGKVVTLDVEGNYYDIDYSKLSNYISKPSNPANYILQNPVGNVYSLYKLTEKGNSRLDLDNPVVKPVAVIRMTPNQAITTSTEITWGYGESIGDIVNAEWVGKESIYPVAGSYTVKLRVQSSDGLWSDWVEQSFYVIDGGSVKQIVAGGNHTLALMNDGSVYSWGRNNYGQLGLGDKVNRSVPTKLVGLSDVKELVAGHGHTLALMNDGSVYSWGYNYYGQLGLGDKIDRSVPTKLVGLYGVKDVVAGSHHTLALLDDGSVYVWGYNYFGQLGLGGTIDRSVPTKIVGLSGVTELVAGYAHTLAILEDGSVYSWGSNLYGQLGLGDKIDRSVPTKLVGLSGVTELVVGGFQHTLALLDDGSVYSWGYNNEGQLGLGDKVNRLVPTKLVGLSGVTEIAAGYYHTLALLDDGSVYSWGDNGYGQLGLGDTVDRSIPTKIIGLSNVKEFVGGDNHTLALLDDGSVYSWGSNGYGQLGLGDTVNRSISKELKIK